MRKVFNWAKKIFRYSLIVLLVVESGAVLAVSGLFIHEHYFGKEAVNKKVYQIYKQIVIASGQSNNTVPFYIENSQEINAYTDGTKIVLFTGLIENSSWDAIALTIGHELAHHQLMHTRISMFNSVQDMEKAEAVADKLGAFFMMKAGYDICEARKSWKTMRDNEGNYLGGTHPTFSYRYDELNVNCGD